MVLVNYYFTQLAERTRKVFALNGSLSNVEIIKRIYYISGNGDINGVTVVDGTWSGPKGVITIVDDERNGRGSLWKTTDKTTEIYYYQCGSKLTQSWYDNRRCLTDGPVDIVYYLGGQILLELWSTCCTMRPKTVLRTRGYILEDYKYFSTQDQHRTDGPAVIGYYRYGQVRLQAWYTNGQQHRTDGPALIEYYECGRVKASVWYLYGKHHRVDGPAVMKYNNDGQPCVCEWYLNGKHHRVDGPAATIYYEDGARVSEWCLDGKKHRDDGPAEMYWTKSGEMGRTWWYKHGITCAFAKMSNLLAKV